VVVLVAVMLPLKVLADREIRLPQVHHKVTMVGTEQRLEAPTTDHLAAAVEQAR
jgi:hypothetical protein